MNALFNSALKQSAAIKRDLDAFAESPSTTSPALQGQISASIASFSRTIDDYSALSKRELIPEKQSKAYERAKNFRTTLGDYREQFEGLLKIKIKPTSLSKVYPLPSRSMIFLSPARRRSPLKSYNDDLDIFIQMARLWQYRR